MTKDEALKMAIEFMETLTIDVGIKTWNEKHRKEAIQACKEALAQPAKEPVVWECFLDSAYYDMWAIRQTGNRNFEETIHVINGKEAKHLCAWLNSLNTHPAPSWVGLSDDENEAIIESIWVWGNDFPYEKYRRTIETKLKEKNKVTEQ